MKRFLLVMGSTLGVVAVGCGGNSFTGTVAGDSLTVKSAIFGQITSDDQNAPGVEDILYMTDGTDLCAKFQHGISDPSITTFGAILVAEDTNGQGISPPAAKYEVGTDLDLSMTTTIYAAFPEFSKFDANCQETVADSDASGTSGFLQVDSVTTATNGTLDGSFDITFGSKDVVKGTIHATFCDFSNIPQLACGGASGSRVPAFSKRLQKAAALRRGAAVTL